MQLRSLCAVALTLAVLQPLHVQAAPPTTRVVAAAFSPTAQWITHEIVNGERLDEIAARYAVSVGSILRWNRLDPRRPLFWVGEQLKILTQLPDRARNKYIYIVRPDDTWATIAERFHVDVAALQKLWNPHEQRLALGHQLTVWVEPDLTPEPLPVPKFTLKPVPQGAESVGWPDNGRLKQAVQIPENPELYTLRNMDHAYGSTHAIGVLQQSIATFRIRTGYNQPITLWDMSTKRGGRYGPHRSHRTGRDIDIGLPLRADYVPGVSPVQNAVDWVAMWHLVRTFIETGEVRYIFLSRPQQAGLYRAAKACGATHEELDRLIQFPRYEKIGIVRDAPGHTGHIHVRFLCGPEEADCKEYQ
ncbi:MAG: penicillin-insensitive murein endopeptidase [Polyangiales bacterium]